LPVFVIFWSFVRFHWQSIGNSFFGRNAVFFRVLSRISLFLGQRLFLPKSTLRRTSETFWLVYPASPRCLYVIQTGLACGYQPEVLLERITSDTKQCGGRPCIRGMRIRVSDVLDLLAAGLGIHRIFEEMPDLEVNDIKACLAFTRRRIDHPSITG
jgi:uncharacterized protein (DUF433 family)